MRALEITLAVILAIRIVLVGVRRDRWIDIITVVAFGVMALHLGIEGYRWQMLILYGITLWMSILLLWRLSPPKESVKPRRSAVIKTLGLILLLGLAILPPILLPIPRTPAPTGPHSVGTFSVMLVDESRQELYSPNPNEPRAIIVQVWYPTEAEPDWRYTPWMHDAKLISPAIAEVLGLPQFLLGHIRYTQTYAYNEAPLLEGGEPYPVLLFSHGWNGFRAQNSYQMEELASYGYVVVAPDHTYGAVATVFPDGRIIPNNPDALPDGLPDDEYRPIANKLARQWVGDLSFILDSLAADDFEGQPGISPERLDLTQVGVLGHSTGGGAAVEFCASDARCVAILGMDTYMKPVSDEVIAAGLSQTGLYMFSEDWPSESNTRLFSQLDANSSNSFFQVSIRGTAHYDFTALPAFSPLAHALMLKGPIDGERVLEIINNYTVAFFDQTLRGQSSPLLDGPSPEYPEVEFTAK
jgi:pimeloyl-ACP methyl ester carboxylesterase